MSEKPAVMSASHASESRAVGAARVAGPGKVEDRHPVVAGQIREKGLAPPRQRPVLSRDQ